MTDLSTETFMLWLKKKKELTALINEGKKICSNISEESNDFIDMIAFQDTERIYNKITSLKKEIRTTFQNLPFLQSPEMESSECIHSLLKESIEKTYLKCENAKQSLDTLLDAYISEKSQDMKNEQIKKISLLARIYTSFEKSNFSSQSNKKINQFYCTLGNVYQKKFDDTIDKTSQEYISIAELPKLISVQKEIDVLSNEMTKIKNTLKTKAVNEKERVLLADVFFPAPKLTKLVEDSKYFFEHPDTYIHEKKKMKDEVEELKTLFEQLQKELFSLSDEKIITAITKIETKKAHLFLPVNVYNEESVKEYNALLQLTKQLGTARKNEIIHFAKDVINHTEKIISSFNQYKSKAVYQPLNEKLNTLVQVLLNIGAEEESRETKIKKNELTEKIKYYYGSTFEEKEKKFPTPISFIESMYEQTMKTTVPELQEACTQISGYGDTSFSFQTLTERINKVKKINLPTFEKEDLTTYQLLLQGMRQFDTM